MYDSLTMFVASTQTEKAVNRLDAIQEIANRSTGEIFFKGNIGNLRVRVKSNSVFIVGSLAKFHFGNNFEVLTKKDTKAAIEKLSDIIGLDVAQARVYVLEIGSNFSMQEPVQIYCQCLGECRFYDKSQYKHGLLYSNLRRSLTFYDKLEESSRHKERVPESFDGAHLLRYELKFKNRLSAQLGKKGVLARQLYDESFYALVLEKWQSEYFKIRRINKLKIDGIKMSSLNTPKKLETMLAAIGLQTIGEQNMLSIIKEKRNALSKVQLSRLKAKIRELAQSATATMPQEAILELDSKIRQSVISSQ